MERHQGELFPRIGFIVTNLSRMAKNVVRFYNKRKDCENHIKEGKYARPGPASPALASSPTR